MLPLSLYIHIPWCIKKCPYCDFNSHAIKTVLPELDYINALLKDLGEDCQRYSINRPLSSIFIGGGTPSLLSPKAIEQLLHGIQQQLVFTDDIEITLEANPSTFESHKFAEFRALGINRLSIGVQSFNDTLLKKLGRVHSAREAIIAADIAIQAGFTNFNIDLMFALPDEIDGASSKNDIMTAVQLNPTHISLYQLTIEPNTYFYNHPPRLPDDTIIFNTQEQCQTFLARAGYEHYEVSAYSQPNKLCRHNLNYWQFGDYLGIGAGAHGKITQVLPNVIYRSFKTKNPEQYLSGNNKHSGAACIAIKELPIEFMMNHLRLKQGFNLETYRARTGLDPRTLEPALTQCIEQKLLIKQNNRYYCSQQGWNFLDTVLEKFIA